MNLVLHEGGESAKKSPVDRYLELQGTLETLDSQTKRKALEEMKAILGNLSVEIDGQIKNLDTVPDNSKIVEDLAVKDAISNIRKGPVRRFFDMVFGKKTAVGEALDNSVIYMQMNDLLSRANEKPEDVNKILGLAEEVATLSGYAPSDKSKVHDLWKGELDKLTTVVSHFISKDVDQKVLQTAVENFVKFSENWMLHLNKSLEEKEDVASEGRIAA